MRRFLLHAAAVVILIQSCKLPAKKTDLNATPADTSTWIHFPSEKHLRNVRQLTFGGDNAEAYWSFDGKKIVSMFEMTKLVNGHLLKQGGL